MSELEQLRTALLRDTRCGYDRMDRAELPAMDSYCRDYVDFISRAKIEREATARTIELAEAAGYRPYVPGTALKAGDKVYHNNRGKSVYFAHIGKKSLAEGCRIAAAHIDSPRLDLKPNPLYEDAELALLKTHYYGGIKKYQWTALPLALHGAVVLADGTKKDVCFGEDPGEPVLYVTDLLIHLAKDQMSKSMTEGVAAEQLNILVGSRPVEGEGADRVKLEVLRLLNEKYGMTEEDFRSAELCVVPAGPARYVGFDRSMILGYGHDDKVCAFACFYPLLSQPTPEYTSVCLLADKEEIGSVGVTGMQSQAFETFLEDLCAAQGVSVRRCFERSFCLSADVTNAFDPDWAETCDKRNSAILGGGVGVCKYTGARGKSGASDASAEAMGFIRRCFDGGKVLWQSATLGKVDQGGGGTVACYMANRNIVTVDAGVPVLSMHAPIELVSTLDAYMTQKAAAVFYQNPEAV